MAYFVTRIHADIILGKLMQDLYRSARIPDYVHKVMLFDLNVSKYLL